MTICSFAALALAAVSLTLPLPARAAAPRYQFTAGETLRFLIQRDPYFAEPKAAMETVSPEAPYRPPVVERLTERVQAVTTGGTATLLVSLAPEPGFEDEDNPQPTITRTVTVSPSGQVLSVAGPPLGSSPAERDLLRGLALPPPVSAVRKDGLAVITRESPPVVTESTSPDHDGTLRQTTSAAQSDHLVFDGRQGQLVREVSTLTITMSLVMTGRGRRGSDDFGHVIPSVQVIQTVSIQRQAN